MDSGMNQNDHDHWLVRPATIRALWWGGSIVLALTVLAQFVIPVKGYFTVWRSVWIYFLFTHGAVFQTSGFGVETQRRLLRR
jgi:hypothetical protein